MNSTIAAVPFTLTNLEEDLADLGSNFDGSPDLEFRHASKALELEQCGLSTVAACAEGGSVRRARAG